MTSDQLSFEMLGAEFTTQSIAGLDEVGERTFGLGPVLAAAVILNPERPIEGLRFQETLCRQAGTVGGADQVAGGLMELWLGVGGGN